MFNSAFWIGDISQFHLSKFPLNKSVTMVFQNHPKPDPINLQTELWLFERESVRF